MPLRLSTSCAGAERRKLTKARAVAASFALAEMPGDLQKQIPYSAGISPN